KDTKGAISEKIINVTIQPMTDLELNVLGMFLEEDEIVKAHYFQQLSDATVKIFQRKINWIYEEQEGLLYHYKMGVEEIPKSLLFEGNTDSSGNIKIKVEPQDRAQNLIHVEINKEGMKELSLDFFGHKDLETITLGLLQNSDNLDQFLVDCLSNYGIWPADGNFYIKNGSASWPYLVFKDKEIPELEIICPNEEAVPEFIKDQIISNMTYLYGENIKISYVPEFNQTSNKIFIQFWDLLDGNISIGTIPFTNLIDYVIITLPRVVTNPIQVKASITQEAGHGFLHNGHSPEKIDSHYGIDSNFSTFPDYSPLDIAVIEFKKRYRFIYPGQIFYLDNGIVKQTNRAVIDDENNRIYYLFPEN
ncbi:MAG TPA: hypothetical protein PLX15_05605, partial [Candidatus Woesearchaeota archaeon]|nr:hypothetical protein [Candidatus Woesearchaeota archaeon]